jgi:hypothetical protein
VLDLAVVGELADLLGSRDFVGGGVASLGLAVGARENNEALLVCLQSGDVGLEGLLREVLSSGVDSDTDGGSELPGDTGFLLIVSTSILLIIRDRSSLP